MRAVMNKGSIFDIRRTVLDALHKHAARSPVLPLSHCSNAFPTSTVVPCRYTERFARNRHVTTARHDPNGPRSVSRYQRGGSLPSADLMGARRPDVNIVGGVATVNEEKTYVNSISISNMFKDAHMRRPASARDAPPEHFDVACSKCDPEDHTLYGTVGIPFSQCQVSMTLQRLNNHLGQRAPHLAQQAPRAHAPVSFYGGGEVACKPSCLLHTTFAVMRPDHPPGR